MQLLPCQNLYLQTVVVEKCAEQWSALFLLWVRRLLSGERCKVLLLKSTPEATRVCVALALLAAAVPSSSSAGLAGSSSRQNEGAPLRKVLSLSFSLAAEGMLVTDRRNSIECEPKGEEKSVKGRGQINYWRFETTTSTDEDSESSLPAPAP